MALNRTQKQKIIQEIKEKILRQKAIIFVDFTGLKVKDLSDLRKKLKASNNEIKIAKKTLMGIAFKETKIGIEPKKLPGEIALVFGFKDEISPAKIIFQFSEKNQNLKILGGWIENSFFEPEKIIELAKLPTKEELLTKLINTISAPISNFINVMSGNLKNLIFVLNQIQKVKQ